MATSPAQTAAGNAHLGTSAIDVPPGTVTGASRDSMTAGPPWTEVSVGASDTCGIRADGSLWCWGANTYGQLGTGEHASRMDVPQPVTRPARGGWASVSAGAAHTCATRTNGNLWCWGASTLGQLGTGEHASRMDVPQQVTHPARGGWASVSAGGAHTCATRTDNTLWCWGANTYGQLGTGTTIPARKPRPVTHPARGGWVSVNAGDSYTCAIRVPTERTPWCWGRNNFGQLGIGNDTDESLPRYVSTVHPDGWVSISAGGTHTCALHESTTLWCWGQDTYGQLGNGQNVTQVNTPQNIGRMGGGGWSPTISSGDGHTCGIRLGASLWCWGHNNHGQLGIGTSASQQDQAQQITVPYMGEWSSISAGGAHTCAIRGRGTLWCWGQNDSGQLGLGTTHDENLPHQVTHCSPTPATGHRHLKRISDSAPV
jgi:alpha-tubulin suppressor-like RCC1 family protein